jgi:hypothetical protein
MRTAFLTAIILAFVSSAQAHPRHHRIIHIDAPQRVLWVDVAAIAPYPMSEPRAVYRPTAAIPRMAVREARGGGYRHYYASGSGITHARLPDGQTIAVASAYADRFVGFFTALYRREGHLPEIVCLASGHMAHSLHHWGGACDVGQTARNVAWRAMYHVGALAAQFGLTDGCIWNHPDCGHVDVSGIAPRHYASRRRVHYASR